MIKADKITRLKLLKEEEFSSMRHDVARLDSLVQDAYEILKVMLTKKMEYEKEMENAETIGSFYFVEESIERRRFYAQYVAKCKESEIMYNDVKVQHTNALKSLNDVYTEMRSYDIMIDKKAAAHQLLTSRKQYSASDEQQSLRISIQD